MSIHLLADRSAMQRLITILAALLMIVLAARALHLLPWRVLRNPYRSAGVMSALLCVALGSGAALSPGLPKLSARKTPGPVSKPNVILVVMDTVRADHTSLYGYQRDTTPFLKELAKEATVYSHSLAVADMTLPTHATIFTGLYPRTHGAYFAPPTQPLGRPLAERFTTMAEILKDHGYRTMALVANAAYLTPEMGLAQGFEVYDWRVPAVMEGSVWNPHLRNTVSQLFDRFVSPLDLDLSVRRAGEINADADRLLAELGKDDGPYFLFLNYMDAHTPYSPPEPFRSAYPCSDRALVSNIHLQRVVTGVVSGKRAVNQQERQCLESQYDAGIAYIDAQVRRFVDSLKARGQYENTLLIVTGDHGEALGNRNQVGHGGVSVYQEEIGVPLLVKYPGRNGGQRDESFVSQVDMLPTVLDIAGIPDPPNLAGTSLRKISSRDSRPLVSVSYPAENYGKLNPQYRRTEEAMLFGGKKLIVSSLGKREIFDLSKDCKEENNLYQSGGTEAKMLTTILEEWNKTVPASQFNNTFSGDRGTIERLKSLGYVQ